MRAVIIGKANADGEIKPLRLNSARKRIKLPDTGGGIVHIGELENYFQDYQIMVMPFDYKFREFKNYIYLRH